MVCGYLGYELSPLSFPVLRTLRMCGIISGARKRSQRRHMGWHEKTNEPLVIKKCGYMLS